MKKPYKIITSAVLAASLGFGAISVSVAHAQPGNHDRDRHDRRNDDRRGNNHDRRHNGPDRHGFKDRHPGRPAAVYHRPAPRPVIVHNYDYNRPDPRFGGYYANNYYRSGYAPIRVTRQTRIYRGRDNRYYCRRSDGTTGLIVGAALGGILGDRIDQGRSSILGAVLGAGTGALLGREIDRGNVNCR